MAAPTRWAILDKACRAVDPSCKVAVNALSKAKTDARLMSLSQEAFEAETAETVAFLAAMRAKTLELRASFDACTRAMDERARAGDRRPVQAAFVPVTGTADLPFRGSKDPAWLEVA